MARYSALLGKRIEVIYRAGDIFLPATGTLAADSGKSIFLEEHFKQHASVKTFRWEIPYQCIIRVTELPVRAPTEFPAPSATPSEEPAPDSNPLRLRNRPETA